ncbi:hypothetical protein HOC13_02190 [Candidatus Woesearchaeota archaeon]|jgi:hypothetical protein|nr:hypothetical protein [Candidatus Woesearchaeota archaeon]
MKDQFIKNDCLKNCLSCSTALKEENWNSIWEGEHHYKTNTCNNCGEKSWIKVNFDGSGDDDWKPLEQEKEEPNLDGLIGATKLNKSFVREG